MASWRLKEDLGLGVVAYIHDQLKFSDDYILDSGRGFTYWPSVLALTVSSDLPNFHNAYSIFRLHAEIDVAHGERVDGIDEALSRMMSRAALSALTYDRKNNLYKMSCTVYAQGDNEAWLSKVFLAAVALQIARADKVAKNLENDFGLKPAISGHPRGGFRPTPDPMVNAVENFFVPSGKQPSRWEGCGEWESAHDNLRRIALSSKTDGSGELTAEFDWLHNNPITVRITAREPHAEYGNGLALVMVLPWSDDEHDRARTAMKLNEMERRDWNWCHDLGSWCIDEGNLAFTCFIPNLAFHAGSLADMTHDMAMRAKWVNDQAALAAIGVEEATPN
jgi:hypothetical protein